MGKIEPTWKREGVTLYHGNCLEIIPTLGTESIDVILTDPPYGIDFQSAWRTESERMSKIENDTEPFIEWLPELDGRMTSDAIALVFCRWDVQDVFKLAMEKASFNIRAQIIWDRVVHGLGDLKRQPAPQHDVVWFGTRGKFSFQNGRPKSIVRVQRVNPSDLLHPNEKPLSLMYHFLTYYTRPHQIILDPLMGSGPVGVACVRTGRRFIGIEVDRDHFNTARTRIQGEQQVHQMNLFDGGQYG